MISRGPQAGFLLRAMVLLSAILPGTGVKANAEVSQMLWHHSTADGIVLQTRHFSRDRRQRNETLSQRVVRERCCETDENDSQRNQHGRHSLRPVAT